MYYITLFFFFFLAFPKESLGCPVVVHFGRQALRPTTLWLASGHLQIHLPGVIRLNLRGEFSAQSVRLMFFPFFQDGKSVLASVTPWYVNALVFVNLNHYFF